MILCISVESVVISLISFLISFIWGLFSLMSLGKGRSVLFILSKNQLFLSFYSLWVLFAVLFPILVSVRLACVCELFLVSWGRPALLGISLLGLLSLCPIDCESLCLHFHLSLDIFRFFPLISLISHLLFGTMLLVFMSLFTFQFFFFSCHWFLYVLCKPQSFKCTGRTESHGHGQRLVVTRGQIGVGSERWME